MQSELHQRLTKADKLVFYLGLSPTEMKHEAHAVH